MVYYIVNTAFYAKGQLPTLLLTTAFEHFVSDSRQFRICNIDDWDQEEDISNIVSQKLYS